MKRRTKQHSNPRILIDKLYFCGEDLVVEYNQEINNYVPQEELDRRCISPVNLHSILLIFFGKQVHTQSCINNKTSSVVIFAVVGVMKRRTKQHSNPRILIDKLYFCGEDLVVEYNQEINNYVPQEELDRKYGKKPWFLEHPSYPPPYKNFFASIEDTLGRLYNFPVGKENEAHVCLPRMKALSIVGRELHFPVNDEIVELKDGTKFSVTDLITFPNRRNTAIIYITYLK